MEISDVHVKIIRNSTDRLKAVCTITFENEFVVRDVKVVEGTNGMFVAMPSRKLSVHCKSCSHKNHLRAKYCNECGTKLNSKPMPADTDGRTRLHRDIAHPITPAFREQVQEHVIKAYEEEFENQKDSNAENEELAAKEVAAKEVATEEVATEEVATEEVEADSKPDPSDDGDKYNDLIAGLKGSKNKQSSQSDSDTSDRSSTSDQSSSSDRSSRSDDDSDNYQSRLKGPVSIRDDDDDDFSTESYKVSSSESDDSDQDSEPDKMVESDLEPDSINQGSSSDDDDTGFGAGIL